MPENLYSSRRWICPACHVCHHPYEPCWKTGRIEAPDDTRWGEAHWVEKTERMLRELGEESL